MQEVKNVNTERQYSARIDIFQGLNRTYGAGDGEAVDIRNLSTDKYPALTTRAPRSRVGTWESATDVYEVNGHTVVVDGYNLYWDGTMITGLNPSPKQFALVGGKLVIWPDRLYIDTQTGKVRSLEVKVTASATIGDDRTIAAGSPTASLTGEYHGGGDIAPGEARPVWITLYKNLRWENGEWAYDQRLLVQGGPTAQYIGWYFIGPALTYAESQAPTPTDYDQYGRLTAVDLPSYTYEQYDRTKGAGLTDYFEAGDSISISGSTLLVNNREAALLEDVQDGQLTLTEGTLIKYAKYLTVSDPIAPGTYYFAPSSSSQVTKKKIKVPRTIRAGEQIVYFETGETTVQQPWNQWEPSVTMKVSTYYVYDPKIRTFEELEEDKFSGGTGLTTITVNNTYSGAAETLTFERKVPKLAYICAHNNRLYGVSNEEKTTIYNTVTKQYEEVTSRTLFASALGYPTRFYSFEGLTTDSYAVAIGGNGDFTGICEYSNAVLAWKEDAMYRLTGDYPAEYYLRNYVVDGVKAGAHGSLTVINETLYYLSPYGVMRYAGSTPVLTSYNLGLQGFTFGAAGRDKMHYLLSLQDEDGTWKLYSYDTVHGLWTISGEERAQSICRKGDYALLCIGGKVYRTGDAAGTEEIAWSVTLPEWTEASFRKKQHLYVRIEAEAESGNCTLEYRTNGGTWRTAGTLRSWDVLTTGRRDWQYELHTERCERLQLRLSGSGKWTLRALERIFVLGSSEA